MPTTFQQFQAEHPPLSPQGHIVVSGTQTNTPVVIETLIRSSTFGKASQSFAPDFRSQIAVCPYDVAGALTYSTPIALFDEFLLQSVTETNRDNVQFILGSDAAKMYALGQGHRIFSISATILDTDLNRTLTTSNTLPANSNAENQLLQFKGWSGNGRNAWDTFFNTFANITACARNRTLVCFKYTNRAFYGAFTGASLSHSAMGPHQYELSASFYAVYVDSF